MLVLVFFLDLVPDIVYWEIAIALFWYLILFKLNFKLGCCYSVLNTLSNNILCAMFWRSMKLPFKKKMKTNSMQRRTLKKSYEYLQTLSKLWRYCTKIVLNRHSDAFYRVETCAFILEIFVFKLQFW